MIELQNPQPQFHINLKWKQNGEDTLHETGPIPVTKEEFERITGGKI